MDLAGPKECLGLRNFHFLVNLGLKKFRNIPLVYFLVILLAVCFRETQDIKLIIFVFCICLCVLFSFHQ